MGGTLVVIETSAGTVCEPSLELLTPARQLAVDEPVVALVVGSAVADAAEQVAALGAERTLVVDSPLLGRYTIDGYRMAIEAAIHSVEPRVVLLPGTTSGRDLGPFLAARAGVNCLSDCVALRWDGGDLVATRPVYQGRMRVEARLATLATARPIFVVARAGVWTAPEASERGSIEALPVDIAPGDQRVRLRGVTGKATGAVNLEGARTIVVGGRGVGSAEGFALVEELAATLDAAVGATRAVTDAGWRPRAEQVGQTGRTVKPKLYIGLGVSGAVQHLAGMRGSETIVAVNQDPDAPIFRVATIGVVGDLHAIVPALLRELRGQGSA